MCVHLFINVDKIYMVSDIIFCEPRFNWVIPAGLGLFLRRMITVFRSIRDLKSQVYAYY